MKFFIILSSLIAVHAVIVPEECNGVTFRGVYHERELLRKKIRDYPYLLTVDYDTNNLYFSYMTNAGTLNSTTNSARLNIDTKDFRKIKGINKGFAATVDQVNHEVYLGGTDGIYKYNISTNEAHIIAKDVNIWNLYYKDVLYYTIYPSRYIYTFVDGVSNRFADLDYIKMDFFVIDNEDVMFFTNNMGLYSQTKGTKDALLIEDLSVVVVRALTTDKNGDIYLCLQDGIYAVKDKVRIEKVLDIHEAYGVTFDKDNNMVYADENKIVRLKPNPTKNC